MSQSVSKCTVHGFYWNIVVILYVNNCDDTSLLSRLDKRVCLDRGVRDLGDGIEEIVSAGGLADFAGFFAS